MQRSFAPVLVLYAKDIIKTVAFYETLGIVFRDEKHGDGPLHAAADFGGFVLEVYPKPPSRKESGTPGERLVFRIDDVEGMIELLTFVGHPVTRSKPSAQGPTILTRDPDGREILLIRSQS